jgi:hypothetical protein
MLRSGSVLIFAIAVTALLLTAVFGFVRVAQLQRNAGSAGTQLQLARQAAIAGSQHALEQILRQHDDANETVTRLDGPAMAAFRPILFPWRRDKKQIDPSQPDSRLIGINDSTTEDLIPNCALSTSWNVGRGGYHYGSIDPLNPTMSNWDGRARWYEVEVANANDGAEIPASKDATTATVRFSDADGELMDSGNANANDAASLAAPARCAPIMYDRQWRRLAYADAAEAVALRQSARYRLRYAVGVRDLEGSLLINPDPSLDYRSFGASADPRSYAVAQATAMRAWHAMPNIVALMAFSTNPDGTHPTAQRYSCGVRTAHVLLGRGSAANYNRVSDADPWPRTWPLMYRGAYTAESHWLHLAGSQGNGLSDRYRPLPTTNRGPWFPLFANTTADGATATAAGGQQLDNFPRTSTWRNVLTGPQFSSYNTFLAIAGGENRLDNGDGQFEEAMLGFTPFGRAASGSGVPWTVNPLTAPLNVLRGMVLGSLPAGVLQVKYVAKPAMPATPPGNPSSYRASGSNSEDYWAMYRMRDLWVETQSAAFATTTHPYKPPARLSPAITPDYHVLATLPSEEGFIHPSLRYPGPVGWNVQGTTGNTNAGASPTWHDDLGSGIDVSDQYLIADPYFASSTFNEDDDRFCIAATQILSMNNTGFITNPFLTQLPNDDGWSRKDTADDANPDGPYDIPGSNPTTQQNYTPRWDRVRRDYTSADLQIHSDSFYRDIVYAFSNAVAMMRAANCRLPVGGYVPAAADLAHSGILASRPTSLADLDRLFLRCLGIDIANPASAPVDGFCGASSTTSFAPRSFTANRNIYSLASDAGFSRSVVLKVGDPATTVPSGMLTQVMERMLNDFRLTMLGSNPDYASFRPLDFNGDGRVACSGYEVNPTYVPGSMAYACHVVQDQPSASGKGPAVTMPFSVAGNFSCGRSRFWEVWVRGEVFDNVAKRPVSQATLQTVFVIDARGAGTASLAEDAHAIFRRWHNNMSQGLAATGR